jgi:NADPH-dependent ferric siderophore reductase
MGIMDTLAKRILNEATIVLKRPLSGAAWHLRIQHDSIKTAVFQPGYFLRLGVGLGNPATSMSDKVRSYSVWNRNRETGTIDLAIATHSNGIGAQWVRQCKEGDAVHFAWKKGTFLLDDSADNYLMIGDLSALSHLYCIAASLHAHKRVESFIYSENKHELFPDINALTPFQFHETPLNPLSETKAWLSSIVPGLTGKTIVYVAGDSRLCVALNQYFRKELNWPARLIKTKPFWNPDKKGLE